MYRHKTIISHVYPSLCRKGDSLHRDRIEHILSRGESPGSFDVVVMPTKKKVRTEVEVLVPAVTGYIRRVRYTQPKPQFVTLAPRINCLDTKTGHHEMKRRRQVSPQGVAIEISTVQRVPWRAHLMAREPILGSTALGYKRAIELLDSDPLIVNTVS